MLQQKIEELKNKDLLHFNKLDCLLRQEVSANNEKNMELSDRKEKKS